MRPSHNKKRKLHNDHVRPNGPIREQRRCIVRRIGVKHNPGYPHNSEMTGKQERDTQTEQKLRDLGAGVAKMPTLIERPQTQ